MSIDTEHCLELFGGESTNGDQTYGSAAIKTGANAHCLGKEILFKNIYKKNK